MEVLDKLSQEDDIHVRQMWLPEMPADILLADIEEKYAYEKISELKAVIGELDDPYNQQQHLLELNYTSEGNALIYGAIGSGKEMMLNVILYSLYSHYSPMEFNTYILDFGSESLRMFENVPHTGSVIIDGEDEKLANFFAMLEKELKKRKKLLSEYNGDIVRYNQVKKDKLPYILVILNNIVHFMESYDRYEDKLLSMTLECPKYGIYFTMTATSALAVKYKLQQNFRRMFVMQMNDKSDYYSILGNTGGVMPSPIKGRGVIKTDEAYIFQTAKITINDEDLRDRIDKLTADLSEKFRGEQANQITMVPRFIGGKQAAAAMDSFGNIPLGISYSSYDYLRIKDKEKCVLLITGEYSRDTVNCSCGITQMISKAVNPRIVMLNAPKIISYEPDFECELVSGNYEQSITELYNTCLKRNNEFDVETGRTTEDMSDIVIVINGYAKIKEGLSEDGQDKLISMIEKSHGFWNIHFIIADSVKALAGSLEEKNGSLADRWVSEKCFGEGIWVGNGVADQKYLLVASATSLKNKLNSNTGYYISNLGAEMIRLIMPSEMEEEEI